MRNAQVSCRVSANKAWWLEVQGRRERRGEIPEVKPCDQEKGLPSAQTGTSGGRASYSRTQSFCLAFICHSASRFIATALFSPPYQNWILLLLLSPPFYLWESCNLRRENNLPKVTQPVSDKVESRTRPFDSKPCP